MGNFVNTSENIFYHLLTQVKNQTFLTFKKVRVARMSSTRIIVHLLITLFWVHTGSGLHSLTGNVESGNYSYYVLKVKGPILLQLKSLEGDADLYVSDGKIEHPTFELDEHEKSSWTCGLDKVFIPTSFGRPINIGVYGNPRFDLSHYVLTADFLTDDEMDHFAQHPEDFERPKPNHNTDYETGTKNQPKFASNMGTMLYWLLEILVEILTAL